MKFGAFFVETLASYISLCYYLTAKRDGPLRDPA